MYAHAGRRFRRIRSLVCICELGGILDHDGFFLIGSVPCFGINFDHIVILCDDIHSIRSIGLCHQSRVLGDDFICKRRDGSRTRDSGT